MSRAPLKEPVIVSYSVLAALDGTVEPVVVHRLLLTLLFSPRSVRAIMFRVFVVVPLLFVTQISTRLMVTPVVRFGSVRMPAS